MKKFEYLVVVIQDFDTRQGKQDYLTRMGADGWELASTEKFEIRTEYIFKREKAERVKEAHVEDYSTWYRY